MVMATSAIVIVAIGSEKIFETLMKIGEETRIIQ